MRYSIQSSPSLLRVLSSPYQPSELSCRISICPSPSRYDLPEHLRILHLTKTWANDELGGERVQADWDHVLIASADYYFYVSYPEGTNPFVALNPVLPIAIQLLTYCFYSFKAPKRSRTGHFQEVCILSGSVCALSFQRHYKDTNDTIGTIPLA
jgi:hypothetical protein